jgi:hypothetical protein
VITYASETWVLTEYMKRKLPIIERKILRRKVRPTKAREGTWIIKTNDELNNLIRNKNIINYIEAQRLSCFGHVHQITYDRIVKKIEWKPIPTRLQEDQKLDGMI